eukprot:m.225797 g.225797  ORF g.225797 m.225797 type:complete len:607 (+) comp40020_c0_seq7:87-1907(+)
MESADPVGDSLEVLSFLIKHMERERFKRLDVVEELDARHLNIKKKIDSPGIYTLTHTGKHEKENFGVFQLKAFPFGYSVDYFEVRILQQEGAIGIGLAAENYDLLSFPGWRRDSVAFHSDDGSLFHEAGKGIAFADPAKTGSVIGCGIDYLAAVGDCKYQVFFTRNGSRMGRPVTVDRPRGSTFYVTVALEYSGNQVQIAVGPQNKSHWLHKGSPSIISSPVTPYLSLLHSFLRKDVQRIDCRNIIQKQNAVGYTLEHNGELQQNNFGVWQSMAFPFGVTLSYFEVRIIKQRENISVGLAAENYNMDCLPGRSSESIAFQSNDGYLYHQSERGRRFADSVRQGDVIGCGINYPTHLRSNEAQVYFTHNGDKIGSVVTVRLPQRGTLFATIALGFSKDKVRVFIGPESKKSWQYRYTQYTCQYQVRCREVVEALKVPGRLLDAEWNKCYCSECYNEEDVYLRGNPPKRYGMPKGWVRFGIKVDSCLDVTDIFNSYHVAFHGTSWGAVKKILESRQLLLPGDTTAAGFTIPLPNGHIRDGEKSLVPVAQKPNRCSQNTPKAASATVNRICPPSCSLLPHPSSTVNTGRMLVQVLNSVVITSKPFFNYE